MLKQIEGSQAVAEAVAMCRPEVIAAYPITPQTHIVEGLATMVRDGRLGTCEYINVESEFAALSAAIGASAAGGTIARLRRSHVHIRTLLATGNFLRLAAWICQCYQR